MDFFLDSHKKTSFMEIVLDHDLKCWNFFLFAFFLLQYRQAAAGLKNFFFFGCCFSLVKGSLDI